MIDRANPDAEVLLRTWRARRREHVKRGRLVVLGVGVIAIVIATVGADIVIEAAEAVAMHTEENVGNEERPIVVAAAGDIDWETQVEPGRDGIGLRDDQQMMPLEKRWLGFERGSGGVCRWRPRESVHQGGQGGR